MITVAPIPIGQHITMREVKRKSDGRLLYFFEASNPTTVECVSQVGPMLSAGQVVKRVAFGSGIIR